MRVTKGGSNGSVHNKEHGEVKPNDRKQVKTESEGNKLDSGASPLCRTSSNAFDVQTPYIMES